MHENSLTVEIDGRWYNVRGADAGLPPAELVKRALGGPFPDEPSAVAAAKARSDETFERLVSKVAGRTTGSKTKVRFKPGEVLDPGTTRSGPMRARTVEVGEGGEGRDLDRLIRWGNDAQLLGLLASENTAISSAAAAELEWRKQFSDEISDMSPDELRALREQLIEDRITALNSTTGKHETQEVFVGGGRAPADIIDALLAGRVVAAPTASAEEVPVPPSKPRAPAPEPSAAELAAGVAPSLPGQPAFTPPAGTISVPPSASARVAARPAFSVARPIGATTDTRPVPPSGGLLPITQLSPAFPEASTRPVVPQRPVVPDQPLSPRAPVMPALGERYWPVDPAEQEALTELIRRVTGFGVLGWESEPGVPLSERFAGPTPVRPPEPELSVEELPPEVARVIRGEPELGVDELPQEVQALLDRDGTVLSRIGDAVAEGAMQWIDSYQPPIASQGNLTFDTLVAMPLNAVAAGLHGVMAVFGGGAAGIVQGLEEAGVELKGDAAEAARNPFFAAEPFGFGVMRLRLAPKGTPPKPVPPSSAATAATTLSSDVLAYRAAVNTYKALSDRKALDREFREIIPEAARPAQLPAGSTWRELARQYLVARRLELGDRSRLPREPGVATTPGPVGPERQLAAPTPPPAGVTPDELTAIAAYRQSGDVADLAGVRMTPEVRALLESGATPGAAAPRVTIPEGDRRIIVGALEKPVEPTVALRYVEAQLERMAEAAATEIVKRRKGGRKPKPTAAELAAKKAETTAQLKAELEVEKEVIKAQLKKGASKVISASLAAAAREAPTTLARAAGAARAKLSAAERQVQRALSEVVVSPREAAALARMPVAERMIAMLKHPDLRDRTAAVLGRRARTRDAVAQLFAMSEC